MRIAFNRLISISAVMLGALLGSSLPVRAVDYTWTNIADQSSGYWTNGVLWGNLVGNYPGSTANTPNTYLTNNVSVAGGSYTNILNLTPVAALTSLVISNGNGGEAWLIVTNNPAGTGVTLTTPLTLGSGGRLQIDNKGTVNIGGSAFNWRGTNGAIWLNNGGNLVTTGAKSIGASGGVTGLVTSVSGPGNGGVWNFTAGALTIGGASGHANLIRVTDGAVLTNVGALTLNGSRNSFIVTNGGRLFGSGIITVGGAAGEDGNTLTMGAGLWNVGGNIYIGASAAGTVVGSSNNTFNVIGGTVTNVISLFVGTRPGAANASGASDNSFIVTNGGRFFLASGGIGIGGFDFAGGGNNTVILSNSLLRLGGAFMVGRGSSNNTLSLLKDTVMNQDSQAVRIGFDAAAGNAVIVDGGILTNTASVTIGSGAGNINSGNALIVTNQGTLAVNASGIVIGTLGSVSNLFKIDGGVSSGAFVTNIGAITVGNTGSGYNTLTVTNARLFTGTGSIGILSSNNTATILADATWNLRGGDLGVGNSGGTGNVLTVNGGIINGVNIATIGFSLATGNSLLITNGGMFAANTMNVGNGNGNNRVLVTDGGLLQANSLVIFTASSTVSNRNATYQFTNAPTAITPFTPGNIALTDGTISFRATGAANVATNASNPLRNIRYAGINTFTLNNASNTAVIAGVNQTYTFDAIVGNPSNFVNLVMVNGTTAYGNANGANLTIGSAGSMLVSNTTATISGLFTNHGSLRIVNNSTASFTSNVFQGAASTAFIDNSSTFAASAYILTNTGTLNLQGGTLVLRDLRNQGHLVATGGGLISNALINDVGAYIDIVSGTLTGTPDLVNFGVITNNATFQIGSIGTGTVTNSGTLVLNSATFLSGQFTNTGVVRGNGIVSGPVLNSGVVAGTNGTLTLLGAATGPGAYRADTGGTLTFQGGGSLSSLWNTGGTIRVVSTVTNTGSLFINAGTLAVVGASYLNNGAVHNLAGGVLTASAARVTVGGLLTNDGTLTFMNSVGTFASAVVNRGAWITELTTNVFLSSYTVTTNGYISASAGDVFVFRDGLRNQSTNNVAWQTLNVTPGTNNPPPGTMFEFIGTSVTQTQVFYHPGLLLTGGFTPGPVASSNGVQDVTNFSDVSGFVANFALGQLWVTNTTLVLTQALAGAGTTALFVNDLFLLDASNTRLVIGDNMRLYFVNSNDWNMASITLLGNGEIHQLNSLNGMVIVIPEPSVLFMVLIGFLTLWSWRKRLPS